MGLEMNEQQKAASGEDTQLEERVAHYFSESFGRPILANDVWNSISENLGEQEGGATSQFASGRRRQLEIERRTTQSTNSRPNINPTTRLQANSNAQAIRSRLLYPALAAGLVLAILGMLAAVLALSGSGSSTIHREATPTFSPTPALDAREVPFTNPTFASNPEPNCHIASAQLLSIQASTSTDTRTAAHATYVPLVERAGKIASIYQTSRAEHYSGQAVNVSADRVPTASLPEDESYAPNTDNSNLVAHLEAGNFGYASTQTSLQETPIILTIAGTVSSDIRPKDHSEAWVDNSTIQAK